MSTQVESPSLPASMQMAIDVERGLRQQQAGIFFVRPRVVRRVLQSELDIASPWQPPPHRKCCVIPRDRLLWLVALDELSVEPDTRLPDIVILIAQPEEDELASMTRDELLRHYWRLMFHARIDYVMTLRTTPSRMSLTDLRRRIDKLGQTAFDEIRSVLRAEQMLMRPEDDRNIYAEFVAVYHELVAFAPKLVAIYFPSLGNQEDVIRVIGPDCDFAELLNSTRPAGITDDAAEGVEPQDASQQVPAVKGEEKPLQWSVRQTKGLLRKAEWLDGRLNNVRAALSLQLALESSAPEILDEVKELHHSEIQKLVGRLQAALKLSDRAAEPWLTMCEKLLPDARRGFWNANARLLYDLQKVCFDHEHEIYKVDLLRWMLSGGKSPLKRPLPNQRVVMMSKHLRAAALHVPHVKIDPEGRKELSHLLHEAADAAEHLLRTRVEPLIEQVLSEAGFVPTSIVERVAMQKVVQELADRIVERGFMTLGDLRDAISRNQLKMPDLQSAQEFVSGDPLLRADRLMSAALDGLYSRGPFYLRWMQKASSVAFGTSWGRLFTRFIALPFGLAFLILKSIDVVIEHLPPGLKHQIVSESHETPPAPTDSAATPVHHDIVYSHTAMFLVGCVIFALMHFPVFRRQVVWVLSSTWSAIHVLLIQIPRTVLKWRVVDLLLKSFPMMLFRRFVLAPLLATLVFWIILPGLGVYEIPNRWWGLAIFFGSFVLLNSRIGRDTEELTREFFSRTWYRIRDHLLMGIFTLIVDIFRALMDGLERVLYAVDEWLRFRSGESNLTLGIKAIVGLVWSFVHGVIRFCVTLLIEPQLNPIKHFPVVTVSHKIVTATLFWPLKELMLRFVAKEATAITITGLILIAIPGVFGFLAWELKETWKLYKANRYPNLRPIPIGDHGETLLRLLCPGFHSGTVPRLFAKRRRAGRKAPSSSNVNKQAKFVERLHHEATAVRHFVERELIALLAKSRTFRDYRLSVEHVEFTTNRAVVTIEEHSKPGRPLRLEFAEQSGWLAAVIREQGWTGDLEHDEREIFQAALTGIYKLASVDLVREQIERQLATDSPQFSAISNPGHRRHPYDISTTGLMVWPNGTYDVELFYPLDEEPVTHPRPRSLARAAGLGPVELDALIFKRSQLNWLDWQRFWENEQNLPAHSAADFPFKW